MGRLTELWHRGRLAWHLKRLEWKAGFRRQLLGPNTFALLCRTPEGLFAVDPDDMVVGRDMAMLHSGYAHSELKQLLPLIKPESRVLVVGAHLGSLAIPLARRVGEVVAIEPNPSSFQLLEANMALNHCNNVRAHNIAAGDKREELPFLLNRVNSGGSKRRPLFPYLYYHDNPRIHTVPSHRLDDYLEGHFDLVIMDIEGSEVFALRGMPRILGKTHALQVEFLPHHLANVAGVNVATFLEPILPHFDSLWIPSLGQRLEKKVDFQQALQSMLEQDQSDEILFTKTK